MLIAKVVTCLLSVALGEDDPTAWAKDTSIKHIHHSDLLQRELPPDKKSLVLYYLPKCRHCQMAKPFYKASSKLYEDVAFFAVNCMKSGYCAKFGVQSYPSLRLYTDPKAKAFKGPGNAGVHRTGEFLQNKGGVEFTQEMQSAADKADQRLRNAFQKKSDRSANRLIWIKDTPIKSYSTLEELDADRKKGPVVLLLDVLGDGGMPTENCRRGHKFFKRTSKISGDLVHFGTICCSTHFKLCRELDPDNHVIGDNNFPFVMLEGPDERSATASFEKGDTVNVLLTTIHTHFGLEYGEGRQKLAVIADAETHMSQSEIDAAAAAAALSKAETDEEVKAAEDKKAEAEAVLAAAAAEEAQKAAEVAKKKKEVAAAKVAAEETANAEAEAAAKPKKKRKKKKKVKLEL